jgi:hypothetical protein
VKLTLCLPWYIRIFTSFKPVLYGSVSELKIFKDATFAQLAGVAI